MSAGLLIIAALALLFIPSLDRAKLKLESTRVAVSTGDPLAVSAAAGPSAGPFTSLGVATPSSSSSAAAPASGPLDRGQAPALAPAGLVDSGASITPANRKVEEPAPRSDLVVFKTRAASWVEVVDASGVVQLRRTMSSGETAVASGALPLSVTVGRVDSIDVLVRGKPFDVSPLARDNVARFQIK